MQNELTGVGLYLGVFFVQIVKGKGHIVVVFSPLTAIEKVKHVSGKVSINLAGWLVKLKALSLSVCTGVAGQALATFVSSTFLASSV